MNKTLKTVLLTVLTISAFTIAIIEITGISTTAIVNPKDTEERQKHLVQEETDMVSSDRDLLLASIFFYADHHDFGTIKEGTVVKHQYKFKNDGQVPLLIERVIPSCGCTVPHFPTEPIAPGEEGMIDFEFNSANRVGNNHRKITILANIESESRVLTFDAIVEPQ